MPKVSIIIRTKNEEKWIGSCLDAVFSQSEKDFEVVIVDDGSTDSTLELLKKYTVKLVRYEGDYLPGKSLNFGVRASHGDFLVFISGHCVPTNEHWLKNLLSGFSDPEVAGVYGRQEPLPYTSDFDKRDLLTVFGLDKKIQKRDSFFHNANSMIRRKDWEETPFSETVTNIEDRVWAKEVIQKGKTLIYEPEASVYHWHGIHQDRNEERCRNVVRILESLELVPKKVNPNREKLSIVGIIPIRGTGMAFDGRPLMEWTIRQAKTATLLSRVVVSTDLEATAMKAKSFGAETPFLRPSHLSRDFVPLDDVILYSVEALEKAGQAVDVVVLLKETYPFRGVGMIDEMIRKFLCEKVDTLIPAVADQHPLYRKNETGFTGFEENQLPRNLKDPYFLSCAGVGLVTSVSALKQKRSLVGDRFTLYPIQDKFTAFEVEKTTPKKVVEALLQQYSTDIPGGKR